MIMCSNIKIYMHSYVIIYDKQIQSVFLYIPMSNHILSYIGKNINEIFIYDYKETCMVGIFYKTFI